MASEIKWTDQALNDLESISGYLKENWSDAQLSKFRKLLGESIARLINFPYSAPKLGERRNVRRLVVHPKVVIYYKITQKRITIISIQNPLRGF